jgi:hypothetical protein
MVKVDFLKSIKTNIFFKIYFKPFIILGLLIILSLVLFSCVNQYSLENFELTPKPNLKIEMILWVDSAGSIGNDLSEKWLDFIHKYGRTPNFTLIRENASDFTKYLELDKYPELSLDSNELLKVLKSVDLTRISSVIPFISFFGVGIHEGKAVKVPVLSLITGKDVTYDNASRQLNMLFSRYYHVLYEKADIVSSDKNSTNIITPKGVANITSNTESNRFKNTNTNTNANANTNANENE